jgi:predicted histone-like DNA-binding protein
MAVKYRVKTKPDNISKRETPRYYAIPVRAGIIDLKGIATKLAARSSLSEGDVYSTIAGMVSVIEDGLHDGYSVRVDGLGIFTLSASSEGYDNPEDCTPHRVKARKICYRADPALKKNLKSVKFKRERDQKK